MDSNHRAATQYRSTGGRFRPLSHLSINWRGSFPLQSCGDQTATYDKVSSPRNSLPSAGLEPAMKRDFSAHGVYRFRHDGLLIVGVGDQTFPALQLPHDLCKGNGLAGCVRALVR